jgi:DNA-binding FadR family transcriptional regulator
MLRFNLRARLADQTGHGLSERIAAVIQGCIEDGAFPIGKRLPPERELAEAMGVSRSSLRTAIHQLKTQGLISAVQGGGTRVADHLPISGQALARYASHHGEDMDTLVDLRYTLDCWAAKRAVQAITPEQLERMRRALGVMRDPTVERPQLMQATADFRAAWCEAAGSPMFQFVDRALAETVIHLSGIAQMERQSLPETNMLLEAAQAFCQAMSDRDEAAALKALELHRQGMLGHRKLAHPKPSAADQG